MNKEQRCENCRFYGYEDATAYHICIRFPPTILQRFIVMEGELHPWLESRHPRTFEGRWCGEWQAEEVPSGTEV